MTNEFEDVYEFYIARSDGDVKQAFKLCWMFKEKQLSSCQDNLIKELKEQRPAKKAEISNPFEELANQLREIALKQEETNSKLEKILQADNSDEELITRSQKAQQLDVSLPTLKNWEDQGLIKPIRIGRRVYFKKGTEHPKKQIDL